MYAKFNKYYSLSVCTATLLLMPFRCTGWSINKCSHFWAKWCFFHSVFTQAEDTHRQTLLIYLHRLHLSGWRCSDCWTWSTGTSCTCGRFIFCLSWWWTGVVTLSPWCSKNLTVTCCSYPCVVLPLSKVSNEARAEAVRQLHPEQLTNKIANLFMNHPVLGMRMQIIRIFVTIKIL